MSYAIDFGTSNTVITRWNKVTQQPEILKLSGISQQFAHNPPLIPSLLYVEQANLGKVIAGQTIRDRGLDLTSDPRFFRSFKRGIGVPIQGFLPELDGQAITFEKVGNWFLDHIIAQLHQENDKIEELVLTVPVDSFEAYRAWLAQVCQSWSIEQIRLLDEPTAAALGYGETGNKILFVVDFGGGTLDFSIVQLDLGVSGQAQGFILKWGEKLFGENSGQKRKMARVIAKAGINLGGSDLDEWLMEYFAQTQEIPQSSLILRLAERLKIKLSSQTQATEVYFNDETFESYELSLTQEEFAQILEKKQFFEQLDELMTQVLQQGRRNGIEAEDIESVLLVGGTAQIPSVQRWVQQYFPADKINRDRPFEAIAIGALQLAQGFEVKDFLYHSYGIRYWNRRQNRHNWHQIIPSGQPYPMQTPIELTLGASIDNQPSIELIIGELGANTGTTEVYFEGDRLVTRTFNRGESQVQPLNDRDGARTIAQLTPPGYPGSDRVNIQFWVDDQRLLRITVTDLLTQETLLNRQIVAQLS